MEKSTIRKISILGLVLTTASAVTAAVLPSNSVKMDKDRFVNGSLTKDSRMGFNDANHSTQTCEPDTGTPANICTVTKTFPVGVSESTEAGFDSDSNSSGWSDWGIGDDNTTSNNVDDNPSDN